jgi:glyoxylate/hydroxypyruvate reductase A
VFDTEPLPADSLLWSHPRVILSPHIAGVTSIPGAVDGFLSALEALEAGRVPERVVDVGEGY